MKYFRYIIYIILSYRIFMMAFAGNDPVKKWESKNVFNDDVFIENKGQFENIEKHKVLYKELRDRVYFVDKGIVFESIEMIKEEKGFFRKEDEFQLKRYKCGYEFLNCNNNIITELSDIKPEGYYTFQNSQEMFKGYKKLIYKNVWDNIDIEFTIHDIQGIKYKLIVHPGANLNDIKIKIHSKYAPRLDINGNLLLKTEIKKDLIDHAPISFQNGKEIKTNFVLNGNLLTFNVYNYDAGNDLIIDPWVIVPSNLSGNTGYDVDYDQNGNVYCSNPVMTLAKYNAAGTFQWLFNGSSGAGYFSEFCSLPSGSALWGEGFNPSGAKIYKIGPNGILQITGGPYSTREVWTVFYNRCNGQVMGFGGGTSDMNNLQVVNDTSLTGGTIKNYNGYSGSCCNDVVDAIIDANGDFFAVQVTGTSPEKLQKCAGPAYNPPLLFDVAPGYGYQECNCFGGAGIPLNTNRANVLALNSSYLYTYGGKTIKVWNKTTGALIASQVVNASYIDGVGRTDDGIAVSECNDVYVGGMSTIHAYHFDGSSFTPLTNISTPGAVYDLMLDEKNGLLYAVGNGFLGSYSIPSNISFSLSMLPAVCGACNGVINIANTSTCTSTSLVFNVSPGAITTTNTSIPNLCPQLYTVTASLGCRGVIWKDTITVSSNNNSITVSFNVLNPNCNGSTGSATVMPYSSSFGYTWQPSVSTSTLGTNLSPGTYTVNVSNGGSCSGSGTFQVVQPPPLTVSINTASITCNGGSNGSVTANASGGTAPYTYTWLPSSVTSNSISNLTAGIYTVNVNDANNCSISTTVQIQQPPALSLTATQTQSVSCNGGNNGIANATASGGVSGYTYTWTPSGGNGSTASNLSQGIYTITISDANNCGPVSTTVQITQPPALSLTATQAQSVSCNGGNNGIASATVSGGVGGYTYTWTPTGGNAATANNLTAGIYTLNVQDGNGCAISDTAQIIQPPALSLTATQTQSVSCNGGNNGAANATASGGVGGYTYTWLPTGGNSATASGLTAGIYTLNVQDGNGCAISDTAQITQPPALSITANQTQSVSCNGGNNGIASATASGGVGGYTYTWTPTGGNAATANNLTQGIYTITIKDANNCGPISATVQITQPPALSLTASQTQSVTCNGGNNGIASATASGGVGGYTYTWTPTGGNAATANNLTQGIYTITIKDANNCGPISATVQIQEPPALSITVSGQSVSCYGYSNGSATANVSGGVGGYTYTWIPTGGNSSVASNLIANTYTVNVLDANNCFISAFINIPQPSSITLVTTPNQTICYGNSTNLFANASGGTPSYTYNWSNGLPNNGGPHLVTLTVTTIYTVQVVDANNCLSPVGMSKVTVLPPLLAVGMQTTVCDGLSVMLYPTITSPGNGGPYSYLWSNGQSSSSITVNGNYILGSQNVYTVYISDGCSMPDAVAEVTVNVNPNPVISFSAVPQKGCVPLTVQYFASSDGNNDVYQWYFGNGLSANVAQSITTYTQSGLYTPTLIVTNSNGCVSTSVSANYIEVYPKPDADFTASSWTVSLLEPAVSFYNQSVGASSYTWNFGDYDNMLNNTSNLMNPTHEYLVSGTYTVMLVVENNKGCYDNIAKVIYVEPEYHIYIPNAFTPDGNGINDVFQPKGIGIDEGDYKMLIFDRWGELVFQSNNFRKGWDGSIKGNQGKATQDVYVYKIYVKDLKGNKHEYVGHVTCLPGGNN